MGKIKKILENELVGGTQTTDVYPVTSIKAVYDENNERLDHILNRRGVVNISTNYNSDHIAEVLTLSQALSKVPSTDRVLGFQGKYLTSDGWHTIIYIGDSLTSWSDTTKWIDLSDRILKSISTNATFADIATPSTNPGAPDGNVFYFATQAGTYTNFGGVELETGLNILLWNGSNWSGAKIMTIEQEVGSSESSIMSQRIVTNLVTELGSEVNNKSESLNLVNPLKCIRGKYINTSGDLVRADTDSYAATEFIKVQKSNISSNAVKYEGTSIASYAVYNEEKEFIRSCNETNKYTYISGDFYVRFTFAGEDFIAVYGDEISTYVPYGETKYSSKVPSILNEISSISKKILSIPIEYESNSDTIERIIIESEDGKKIATITEEGLDVIGLKLGGKNVVTEDMTFSEIEPTKEQDDEITIVTDDRKETIASVSKKGIAAKDFYKLDGSPLLRNSEDFLKLAFNKWLCIGDSTTHGFVSDYEYAKGGGYYVQKVSTPLFLSRLTGMNVVNAGHGAWNCKEWWQYIAKDIDYSDIDLVTIEMGYNRGFTDTLEQDVNKYSNYNDYADTDTGCYCKIIEYIKEQNNDIFIVLVIPSHIDDISTVAKVIEQIAEKYSLPIIRLNKKDIINLDDDKLHGYLNSESESLDYVHFNAIGYLYKAELLWYYMKDVIRENIVDVKNKFSKRWCNSENYLKGYTDDNKIILSDMTYKSNR